MRARTPLIPTVLLALGLAAAAPGAAGAALLTQRFRSFDTGLNPFSVAIDDLNGDGKPDLVTANYIGAAAGSVSVLLGNGDGTFGPKADFATGINPYAVAIADFNGDSKLDLVTANNGSNTVSVLLGNGDGTFGPKTDFATGTTPVSVAIADFNGDGKPDLTVANSSTVSVLLGNGDGTFAPKTDFGTAINPRGVATGDLNGDGKQDLVAANYNFSGTIAVWLGNGDGTFGPQTSFGAGNYPQSVAIGDLNGDGKPDLVATNSSSGPGTVAVLLGHGDGTFGPKTSYGAGGNPYFAAIGDLNGDGKPDLAVANAYAYSVSVLLGNGDGSFGPKTDLGTGYYPRSVAIRDLNSDGKPDLVSANGAGTAAVWLGNGDGSFGPNTEYGAGSNPVSAAIADLNGDGKADLAVANAGVCSNNATISVRLGSGDGSFGPRSDFGTGTNPQSVAIGDLNGDGKPDLVTANILNSGPGSVSVLLGNGDGSFGPKSDFATGTYPYSVAIGDLNGDGKPDLVTANEGSNTVSVLLGNGDGSFAPRTDIVIGDSYSSPICVAIGDLNRDGKPDLAVANSGYNLVSVLLGNGDGTFGPSTGFVTELDCGSVAIGDLNRDGKLDLVTTNWFYDNTVSVLLGNGDGSFGPHTDFATGFYPQSVAIRDMDGDGKPDLVTANPGSGTISVLPGSGDGSFGPKSDFGSGGNTEFVAIGDLNADGKPDLAAVNSGTNPDCSGAYLGTVSVLLNTGTPPAAVEAGPLPARFELASPNPNPFRSRVAFQLAVPRSAHVRLEVYDVQGRPIKVLQDGVLAPGRYARTWDGVTTRGSVAPTGIYFVRLTSPDVVLSKQTVLLR